MPREGLGVVLAQKQDGSVKPIAFASRTLQPHEHNHGVTEIEALGLRSCLGSEAVLALLVRSLMHSVY